MFTTTRAAANPGCGCLSGGLAGDPQVPGEDWSFMRRIRVTIAYDGSQYSGWQVQPGRATIQGTLKKLCGGLKGSLCTSGFQTAPMPGFTRSHRSRLSIRES